MSKLNPFTPLPKQGKKQLLASKHRRTATTWGKLGLKALKQLGVK